MLTTTLRGVLGFKYKKTIGATIGEFPLEFIFDLSLADGVGLDQGDLLWFDQDRTLAGSTSEDLDVAGVLSDAYSDVFTAVKIKLLYFHNKSVVAGDILELGGGSNPLLLWKDGSDIDPVGPGGRRFMWEPSLAGKTVTAGTGDVLKVNNISSNSIDYDIAIVGTSA